MADRTLETTLTELSEKCQGKDNYHPTTIGKTVIIMRIHYPSTDFLKSSLAPNVFDGTVY
jgi:hypothetical protein